LFYIIAISDARRLLESPKEIGPGEILLKEARLAVIDHSMKAITYFMVFHA